MSEIPSRESPIGYQSPGVLPARERNPSFMRYPPSPEPTSPFFQRIIPSATDMGSLPPSAYAAAGKIMRSEITAISSAHTAREILSFIF